MSNFLTEARTELAGRLTSFRVYTYRPEGATPPFLVMEARDPYLQPGSAFTDWRMYLSVLCVGKQANNAQATKELDQTVSEVIEAVRGSWDVDSVSAGVIDLGEFIFPAATVQIHTSVTPNI